MPEGHTIHRLARQHRDHLAGSALRACSPQGRFAAGAARLDGDRLLGVEAIGKHLFYRWEGGSILHVHLGLFGKFRLHRGAAPDPTPATRLALSGNGATLYLAGPTVCELIDPADEQQIRNRLGPDPLAGGEFDVFAANLSRRTIPIGSALLNQEVVAGIGNVYRAELLFLAGIHPDVPARILAAPQVNGLWKLAVAHLRRGERTGRIVTVQPAEVGARSRRDLAREERLYVYHRDGEPCRRCGSRIARWDSGGRSIWACPACQAR